jgi:hypothetical protein
MQEHHHVVEVLEKAKQAAKRGDIVELKRLSDQTIHATAIHQDTDNVLVAIVVYSLAKLLERRHSYLHKDFDKYLSYYLKTIDFSKSCIKRDDCDSFRDRVRDMMKVKGLQENLKRSVQSVFQKARINKASKVYEHGISMGATAKLLGISLWDLSGYVGQSTIADMKEGKTLDVATRAKKALAFFG